MGGVGRSEDRSQNLLFLGPGAKPNHPGRESKGKPTRFQDILLWFFVNKTAGISVERNTFSRSERIRKKNDFERFRRNRGKTERVSRGPFVIIRLPNDLDITRIGIRVPKKVGKAYVRNRIKRLIREVFRLNKKAFPPSADLLIIVTERPGTISLKYFMEEIIGAASRLSKMSKTDREKA